MAALLKNQILKHLSKFTKNLSADKINLSTLKGEGELSNLELNEDILTQLLELPTWLRITKAVCNRVAVKIQWTKLKSQPICLYLDEVIVETETCEQPRPPNSQTQQTAGGKYGFVDRVMDGIYIHVNSVVVKLLSHRFHASLQLSRVKVQSMSPTWQTPSELRSTRIRDQTRGEVLLFKEIEWQTTRIEATAIGLEEDFLTPLRLIANQAKIRICVKKRLNDCAIISSRLTLLLDDLLWVLTITQLKAAILYANSLKEVIERSTQQSKKLAAEKLKKQGHMPDTSQNNQQQQQRSAPDRQESTTAKYFSRFDVISTSYHLITSRFDLHLCDDSSPAEEHERHWKINGGSMQITFYKLSIDFYPFHPAGGERKSWYRYMDNIGSRNPWVGRLFSEFRDEAVRLRKICESSPMPSSSSAPSLLAPEVSPTSSGSVGRKTLSPATSHSVNTSPVHNMNQPPRNLSGSRSAQASPVHQAQVPKSTRLLESCFVVKIEDITVYMVSMPGKKRTGSNKLLSSDKRQLHLPPDMSVIHVEFTDYFFPEGLDYPVPHSNLYALINPIRVTLDFLTLLWSNVFLLTLSNSLDMDFGDQGPPEHIDVKVELLMPRIVIPAEEKMEGQPDRPEAVQLQVSKLVVTNRRMEEKMSREDLKTTIDQYQKAKLFTSPDFPSDETTSKKEIIPGIMHDHAADKDNPYIDKAVKFLLDQKTDGIKLSPPGGEIVDFNHQLRCNSLKRLATSDIWSASAEQVWLDFLGVQNSKNRPASFVEAVPVTIWLSVTTNVTQCHECSIDQSNLISGSIDKNITQDASQGQLEQNGECSKLGAHQDGPTMPTPVLSSSFSSKPNRFEDHVYSTSFHYSNQTDHSHTNKHHSGHPNTTDPRHPDSDHSGDGNSFSYSHQQYRSNTDDLRPSRLPVSGVCSSDGSRSSKNQVQPDTHHSIETSSELLNPGYSSSSKRSYSKRDSRHHPSDPDFSSNEVHRGGRSLTEYGSRNMSEFYTNSANVNVGYQDARQRREMHFRRDDSRSSSSPPLLQTDPANYKREELKEKKSKEKRQRHSSSSSSDRRDTEGGERKGREYNGRCCIEGQAHSDYFRSGEERYMKDIKRKDEYISGDAEKARVINRREREDAMPQREIHGQGYRRSRHSSSSGSDVGNTGSRDRRQHRSGSRDSRGNLYERYMEEVEKHPVTGSHRDDREKTREEVDRQLSKENLGRRLMRDGNRESSGDRYERSDGHSYERSSVRSRKRDQMDGIPLGRHDLSPDQTSCGVKVNDNKRKLNGRQHRSQSRSKDSDIRSQRHERDDHIDSYRPRHHPEDLDYRSRLEEASRPRDTDADCDNDRFSHTSHSSLDTLGRDSLQGVVMSQQRPIDHDLSRETHEDPTHWPDDGAAWAQNNKRLPPEGCKSLDDVCQHQERKGEHHHSEPDKRICVLTKVCGKLRVQLNHFQYLFLMRLSESFAAFQADLSADLLSVTSNSKKSLLKENLKPEPSSFIVVPLVLRELEFAVVCPYQMHQRTFSDDFSMVSPFLQGMTTGQDAVFGDDGDGTCFPQLVDSMKGQRSKDDASLKPFHQVITFKSNSSNQLESMSHLSLTSDTSQRSKGFIPAGSNFSVTQTVPVITGPVPFASDSKKDIDIMSQSLNSIGKDSGIGIERKPVSQKQGHQRGGGSSGRGSSSKGASDMKKAFTSAFSSFTDKLKNKMESLDDNFGADDDIASIRTDTSDDDFEHLSLDDAEEVPAFFHDPPPPDVASAGDNYSEVGDPGDSVSMYAESSTTKGKEMVYVVLFKLDHTEMLLESAESQTEVKVQLSKIVSMQLGNISYEDFQTRFQTTKGYLQEEVSPPSRYPICLRYEVRVPDPQLNLTPDPGRIIIRANDFSLQFKMSGLSCLSDFSEDEKLPEFLPMSLEVTNFLLVLEEDRPSASLTSPGTVPMNLHIQQLSIERGKDGVMYITSNSNKTTPFAHTTTPVPAPPKPEYTNAVTSPIMSPDGTMALLMASQNEAVLLRRQLEEVRRANRLYEHQILQWKEMQDNLVGRRPGVAGIGANPGRGGIATKRQSFTADTLSGSPTNAGHMEFASGRFSHDDVDPARDELECENLQLQQRLARLEDDLLTVSKEKESLLQTLQLLQDELLASERKHRTKPK